jgi:hypothetical protein
MHLTGVGGVAVASAAASLFLTRKPKPMPMRGMHKPFHEPTRGATGDHPPLPRGAMQTGPRSETCAPGLKGRRGRDAGRQAGRRREFGVGLNMCLSISPTPGSGSHELRKRDGHPKHIELERGGYIHTTVIRISSSLRRGTICIPILTFFPMRFLPHSGAAAAGNSSAVGNLGRLQDWGFRHQR